MFVTFCFFYDITNGMKIIRMWRWKVFAMWFEISLLEHGTGDPFCALNGFLYLVLSHCGLWLNNVIFQIDCSGSCCVSGFDRLNLSNVATNMHRFRLAINLGSRALTSPHLEILP